MDVIDSNKKNEKFYELQIALENLKESEKNCADAAARYGELEAIIRKQLKSQFLEASELPAKTESNTSCSKSSFSSKTSFTRSSDKQKKFGESTQSLSINSSADLSKMSPEQVRKAQLLKRIRQCHESIEEVATLSGKNNSERKKFFARLNKSNHEVWKIHKSKHPIVGKLEAHLNNN